MASGSIISWKIGRETMKIVRDFISLGSKITADSDYSHEIKRSLLLGRKAMTNLDSILKSRGINTILLTKVQYNQRYGFYSSHVWMWELDQRRQNTKELMLLNCAVGEDSWESLETARRSNQWILKEINSEYSLEWLMLRLKLQYFGQLMRRANSLKKKKPWCWERLKVEGERNDREWDGWMASLTQGTWVWVNTRSCWWTGRPGLLQSLFSQRVGHDWVAELNWTLGL